MSSYFIHSFPWATFGRKETAADFQAKYEEQCNRIGLLRHEPLISLILVEKEGSDLAQSAASVVAQSYPNWELIIASREKPATPNDNRIKHLKITNLSEVAAKNAAIRTAAGNWIGFITAGDVLSPVALFSFCMELERNADVQLVFSNEAKCDVVQNKLSDFFSKPELHWFNLLHLNAIGKFWMIQSSVLQALNLLDETWSIEYEFDLFHRADLAGWKSLHVPMYLYYRLFPEETSIKEKRLIVEKYLKQRGLDAFVQATGESLDVQPILKNPSKHRISVVILFKDKPDWTLRALEKLASQRGQIPIEVVLVNNRSSEESLKQVTEGVKKFSFEIQLVDYAGAFNFGHINNWAIRNLTQGDLILLLNNDVFLSGDNQLDLMAGWAEKEWVGTVGMRLHYEHGTVQHSGLDARFGGNGRLVRVGNGTGKGPFVTQNHLVFGNTFASCMFKRSTFDQLGGFRELDLANGFGDIAFNFECLNRGLKNIYLGTLSGTHLESASRGLSYEYWEECLLEREYPALLQKMLREDLAWNRVPGADADLIEEIKGSILQELRMRMPWLKDLKRTVEKNLYSLKKKRELEA